MSLGADSVVGVLALAACVHVAPSATMASMPPVEAAAPPIVVESPPVAFPKSIDATGQADVGERLQGLIDSVPDGSRILFPKDGIFRVSGGLHIDGHSKLTFDGNGSTILLPDCDNDNPGFWIGQDQLSSDIVIRDFRIEGDNDRAGTNDAYTSDCEYQHAVATLGAARVLVEDVHISKIYGDCLYVGVGPDDAWSTDVTFRRSTCVHNGRQGVAIVAGERVRAEDIFMDDLAMHVLDIEPNDGRGGARDVAFIGNSVGTYGHSPAYPSYFFAANGSLDAPVERVVVTDNVVTGGTLATLVGDEFVGFSGQRTRRDVTFTDNRAEVTAEGPVLIFKHTDNVHVLGNEQPLSEGPLASFIDSTGVVTE